MRQSYRKALEVATLVVALFGGLAYICGDASSSVALWAIAATTAGAANWRAD